MVFKISSRRNNYTNRFVKKIINLLYICINVKETLLLYVWPYVELSSRIRSVGFYKILDKPQSRPETFTAETLERNAPGQSVWV